MYFQHLNITSVNDEYINLQKLNCFSNYLIIKNKFLISNLYKVHLVEVEKLQLFLVGNLNF